MALQKNPRKRLSATFRSNDCHGPHTKVSTIGCSPERFNGAGAAIPPSHGNGSPEPTSVVIGWADMIDGCLEIPGQGTTCPDCHGRLSNDTSWFASMRHQTIQTCAPIGNGERPGKRNFFRLGVNGNWLSGRVGIVQSATTVCTTIVNSEFITVGADRKLHIFADPKLHTFPLRV